VALLDIKLEDMAGTKLLTTLQEDLPRMVKIMITGYPELENGRVTLEGSGSEVLQNNQIKKAYLGL